MSFHILHILGHGSLLSKEKGFLLCKPADKDKPIHKMPLEDIRAIVIAARGVTLTSNAISGVLSSEGIILHCNERYEPCGVTAPLPRIIDARAYLNQAKRPKRLNNQIWSGLLHGKIQNQKAVLEEREIFSAYLERALQKPKLDEGNCARRYWQLYFPSIGWGGTVRDRKLDSLPNQMLNYGYAVLATLCHRAIVIHGLSPLLGVGHTTRYRADPLVYDLMEPYRPLVDRMMAEFMIESKTVDFSSWCRQIGTQLCETRVKYKRYSLKLLYAIDKSAATLSDCYKKDTSVPLWVPDLAAG